MYTKLLLLLDVVVVYNILDENNCIREGLKLVPLEAGIWCAFWHD